MLTLGTEESANALKSYQVNLAGRCLSCCEPCCIESSPGDQGGVQRKRKLMARKSLLGGGPPVAETGVYTFQVAVLVLLRGLVIICAMQISRPKPRTPTHIIINCT